MVVFYTFKGILSIIYDRISIHSPDWLVHRTGLDIPKC